MTTVLALPAITSSIDLLLVSHEIHFWGQDYTVTPVLVPEVFGDGAQIIGLAPLNTRPNYYVVRVDSSWSLNNDDWDEPVFIDHLEPIYEVIEYYFGRHSDECDCEHDCDCDCQCGCDCPAHHQDWPAFNDEVGCEWFWLAGENAHSRYSKRRQL